MSDVYLDTCLLVKLYLDEPGADVVRALAQSTSLIHSSSLARAEFASALHRHLRERSLDTAAIRVVQSQFTADIAAGVIHLSPVNDAILARVEGTYARLPASVPVRAADALHLATAAEAGFREIYSNDARLLAAAPRFKLKGMDPTKK